MTGLGRLRRRMSRPVLAVVAGAAVAILPAACGGTGTHSSGPKPEVSGPLHGWTPPRPEALSPLPDYKAAVQAAVAVHLKVWIETDLVKRWEEGPTWFRAAVSQVAELARQPGVVGIKIADELGYNDGMNSASKISKFLSDAARALHASAPGKLILVDMVVPQLGCLPGHQVPGSPAAACASRERAAYPQLALPEVDRYLRLHAIGMLDFSTYLVPDNTYKGWGTADTAQNGVQEVDKRGWASMVRLRMRKALAHPGPTGPRSRSPPSTSDLRRLPGRSRLPHHRHLDVELALRRPGAPLDEPRHAAERPMEPARASAVGRRRPVHALQPALGHIRSGDRPGEDCDRLY